MLPLRVHSRAGGPAVCGVAALVRVCGQLLADTRLRRAVPQRTDRAP